MIPNQLHLCLGEELIHQRERLIGGRVAVFEGDGGAPHAFVVEGREIGKLPFPPQGLQGREIRHQFGLVILMVVVLILIAWLLVE